MLAHFNELNDAQQKNLLTLWENDFLDDMFIFLIKRNNHVYALKIKKFRVTSA